jgi:hypothetical protein
MIGPLWQKHPMPKLPSQPHSLLWASSTLFAAAWKINLEYKSLPRAAKKPFRQRIGVLTDTEERVHRERVKQTTDANADELVALYGIDNVTWEMLRASRQAKGLKI